MQDTDSYKEQISMQSRDSIQAKAKENVLKICVCVCVCLLSNEFKFKLKKQMPTIEKCEDCQKRTNCHQSDVGRRKRKEEGKREEGGRGEKEEGWVKCVRL